MADGKMKKKWICKYCDGVNSRKEFYKSRARKPTVLTVWMKARNASKHLFGTPVCGIIDI